ncbi:MAG: hypothetical protein KF689_04570 [Gemmatimonadaceae bacterium]|nr:hypothetical protein [Gemmatimonadaceae bacterium]MCW5825554.1 hypothetical protein [Gemmatimonadaceae bacterium]
MRRAAGLAGIALLLLVGAGCSRATRTGAAPPVPVGPTDRIRLDTLPYGARFRWADPRSVFAGVSDRDVERAMSFEAHEQRRFFLAVLDANGWRAVPDSAEYALVALKSTRAIRNVTFVPDPRNEERPDPCAGQLPQNCRPPRQIHYPPRRVVEDQTEVRQLYAVVRLRDGATRWWIVLGENPGGVPVALLQMLRNGHEH